MVKPYPYSERQARIDGDRWVVEWCRGCPKIPDTDDCDLDNADMVSEYFHTRVAAGKRMVEIEKKRLDFFGDPCMTHEIRQLSDYEDEVTGRNRYEWAQEGNGWRVADGQLFQ